MKTPKRLAELLFPTVRKKTLARRCRRRWHRRSQRRRLRRAARRRAKDNILFGKWSGNEVTIDGEELLIMKEALFWALLAKRCPRRRVSWQKKNFGADARDKN